MFLEVPSKMTNYTVSPLRSDHIFWEYQWYAVFPHCDTI